MLKGMFQATALVCRLCIQLLPNNFKKRDELYEGEFSVSTLCLCGKLSRNGNYVRESNADKTQDQIEFSRKFASLKARQGTQARKEPGKNSKCPLSSPLSYGDEELKLRREVGNKGDGIKDDLH